MIRIHPLRRSFSLDFNVDDSNTLLLHENNDDSHHNSNQLFIKAVGILLFRILFIFYLLFSLFFSFFAFIFDHFLQSFASIEIQFIQ
jgi:hypothetical protein